MVIEMFRSLKIKEFSLITNNKIKEGIISNASPELTNKQHYGCGCFHFTKDK
jgi:hypothetical protein